MGNGVPINLTGSYNSCLMFVDTIAGKGANLELLSSTPIMVLLWSSQLPQSIEWKDIEWIDKNVLDFDNNDDFEVLDAGKAGDLDLGEKSLKKKCLCHGRSYKMTCCFHTVWTTMWT